MHHSLIDGVVRCDWLGGCSRRPGSPRHAPPWAIGTNGPDQSGLERPPSVRAPVAEQGGALTTGAKSAASVIVSLTKTYTESMTGLNRSGRAVPFRAPKSVLNHRISASRRFATQSYELDRLRAVAKAAESSLNDVYLTICGGALRGYLGELGMLPAESLTANVPVSVRPEGAVNVGNALSFLFAGLGTDLENPVERLRAIRASMRWQGAPAGCGRGDVDTYTTVLMAPFPSSVVGSGATDHRPNLASERPRFPRTATSTARRWTPTSR